MFFSPVYPSFFSQGAGGSHVTITHDALELTIQGPYCPLPRCGTSLYRDHPPPQSHPKHRAIHGAPTSPPDMFKPMKHVKLASGWFASYWNAFLFSIFWKKNFWRGGLKHGKFPHIVIDPHVLWPQSYDTCICDASLCCLHTTVLSSGHIFYDWIRTLNAVFTQTSDTHVPSLGRRREVTVCFSPMSMGIYNMWCSTWTI